MNDLQLSLLLIGLLAVAAVRGYAWFEQRRYRRQFGKAFEGAYQDEPREPAVAPEPEFAPIEEDEGVEVSLSVQRDAPAEVQPKGADSLCALIGEETDYIAVLTFNTPEGADGLSLLWQKRFDFGKNVHVCGLNVRTGAWEKVIAESHLFYDAFKLSLQLVDRSGPVNELRLNDFRDMVRDIAQHMGIEAQLPDVAEAVSRAVSLDSFCASVDQMIGLNILPSGERALPGLDVARVAERHGLSLQADGAFHLLDAQGHTLFSLTNYEEAPFQHHTLGGMRINGLTLLLDVPRVEKPVQRFDEMAVLARAIAMDLKAAVVDDRRVSLGEAGFEQIRTQVADIEDRMLAGNIAPGSVQAKRLFF